jgi:photosystem II stability/assembly factor-like uncharacterized protein
MKKIIYLGIICLMFASCSKKDTTPDPVPIPAPPIPDTLTIGWTKSGTGFPATAAITDVYFTNSTTGYATSDKGIYKSTDGGLSWNVFNATATTPFNIGGLGNRYCFVGSDNRIHYTNDGTDFFSNTYLLTGSALTLGFRDCFVASPTVLYACSGRYIYKSTNGGVNFDSVYVFPSNGWTSLAMYFTSATNGWLNRSDALYKTTDGGLNWTPTIGLSGASGTGSVDFLNASVGVISDGMNVLKTIDGGATWTTIFSAPVFGYVDVEILSANDIYFSAANKIYKSVNGGASFTQVLSSGENGIVEIHFIDVNTGWACGRNGALYRYKQ